MREGSEGLAPLSVTTVCNTTGEVLRANIVRNLARSLSPLAVRAPTGRPLAIAASGPSLRDTWREIRGDVLALNAAYGFLLAQELVPRYFAMLDAREVNLNFLSLTRPETEFLLAYQCHPGVFDRLEGHRVTPFALITDSDLTPGHSCFGGGGTIGLTALGLACALGYRELTLYGYDSSFEGEQHVRPQVQNAAYVPMDVWVQDRCYFTTPALAKQVQNFLPFMEAVRRAFPDVDVRIVGRGLLPDYVDYATRYNIGAPKIAVDVRADEILKRIEGTASPRGAEIGVYRGELAKRLLARPDLSLLMVDSWEAGTYLETADAKAALSQLEQDTHYAAALDATAFAADRRSIVRARSVAAARSVPDQSLDFVFIDADHSEAGCAADIAAWRSKVRPGGWLCGHDYGHPEFPGVERAVRAAGLVPETGGNFTWFHRVAAQPRQERAA